MSEQFVGGVWIAQLDRKRVPQARSSSCKIISDYNLQLSKIVSHRSPLVPNLWLNSG